MNFGTKLIQNFVKVLIGGIEWVLSYRGKTKCNINPNWWQIFLNFLVLMTKTPGTMTLKKFLPKICTLRGLEARIADFGLKGPGFNFSSNHFETYWKKIGFMVNPILYHLIQSQLFLLLDHEFMQIARKIKKIRSGLLKNWYGKRTLVRP